MFAFKLSWLILLACFIAMVHCGGSSSKKIKYEVLEHLEPKMCNEGQRVYCKNKTVAKYCNKLIECKQYWLAERINRMNLD